MQSVVPPAGVVAVHVGEFRSSGLQFDRVVRVKKANNIVADRAFVPDVVPGVHTRFAAKIGSLPDTNARCLHTFCTTVGRYCTINDCPSGEDLTDGICSQRSSCEGFKALAILGTATA